ncbi:jacalin-related lectin 3-like [Syzygium oleosum]|uniref:jacalin-related lectin 3-like n=1 Tax=Syzygium oleosum TaxID=219896 RepID=UPI0024B93441|nr:jacalin-related lectin 3-like [Syzygium oleosum]
MEYLTSISGYMFQPNNKTFGLASLTFQTNKRKLELIGHEEGKHFSSPATGGKIVGFYGWSGEHLNAIGAYFEPISNLYPIKSIGPFGGHLGQGECDGDWNDGQFDGVRNIEVMHNDAILCIKLVYDNGSQQGHLVPHDGRTREDEAKVTKVDKVPLKYPEEYLTSISGYQRDNSDGINNAIIQSLTFHSNRNTYGPFGEETGRYFWYPSTGSKIIGFFGRCGETLNSIGVYAQPIPHLGPFKTVRPFGNSGGSLWDDGVHANVRAVHILASDIIHSIRIVYDNNGSIVEGSEHGKKGRYRYHKQATLDYPKERLLSISGCMKPYKKNSDPIIRGLKIHTTKKVYGPFGTEEWPWDARENITEFRIPSESGGGRIVGFFGTAGPYLNSIGARLEP